MVHPLQTPVQHLFIVLFACVAPGGGCSGAPVVGPDAGDVNYRLEIQEPPGDDLGLPYGTRVTLRVRYGNEQGEAIPGAPVEFALLAAGDGESTAGSTLSASVATTDDQGIARVDLVAGAQEASFRVSVDARDAPTQYFYVTISNGGFAKLYITPVHEGWRPEDEVQVEVRLYRAERLTCAGLDIDNLPVSLAPPRSLAGFGGTVDYANVMAGQEHTVVAWTVAEGGAAAVAVGCVDLGGAQLPSSRVNMAIVVGDRELVLAEAPVRSRFDLQPVDQELLARGVLRPWQVLGCPAGPGQLVLDCTLDALAPDGALDCVPTGTSTAAGAIAGLRGAAGADGCRPVERAPGVLSVDADVAAAVTGPFAGAELAMMLDARAQIAAGFELDSRLSMPVPGGFVHRLTTLRSVTAEGVYELDLGATRLPVVEAGPVAGVLAGNQLDLAEHGFTLRPGAFRDKSFTELVLTPRGLGSAVLGQALADSLSAGQAQGCAALSALVCPDIGEPAGCVTAACTQGSVALDDLMTGWWRALAAPGVDFTVQGSAVLFDTDGDRVVDAVGRAPDGQSTGAWSAAVWLEDGTAVPVSGAP